MRRRFAAGVALASALMAGAGAAAEPDPGATPREYVGTWVVGEASEGRSFWWELTLYEDGTYCELTFNSDSLEQSPFSLSVGRWEVRGGYLRQLADRSTTPHQVQDVGERDRVAEITAIESVSHERLDLRSLMTHEPGWSRFNRQKSMRRKEACLFPKALPEPAA